MKILRNLHKLFCDSSLLIFGFQIQAKAKPQLMGCNESKTKAKTKDNANNSCRFPCSCCSFRISHL